MKTYKCWLCDSKQTKLLRPGGIKHEVSPRNFRITDSNYGITADIYKCSTCGFLFCPTIGDVTHYYENMEDAEYETTRNARTLQAHKLLNLVQRYKDKGSLLDIGAGSGILVAEAMQCGFDARGVEPSSYLCSCAKKLEIPVAEGVLPHPEITTEFDIATLIDVVEHVTNPVDLLRQITKVLKPNGYCFIVTPDVKSWIARLLGKHWWHYRLAHVGYFDIDTLSKLAELAQLEVIAIHRPGWYFNADYLLERVNSYLPSVIQLPIPQVFRKITIPLNFRDSLLLVCKKKQEKYQHNQSRDRT